MSDLLKAVSSGIVVTAIIACIGWLLKRHWAHRRLQLGFWILQEMRRDPLDRTRADICDEYFVIARYPQHFVVRDIKYTARGTTQTEVGLRIRAKMTRERYLPPKEWPSSAIAIRPHLRPVTAQACLTGEAKPVRVITINRSGNKIGYDGGGWQALPMYTTDQGRHDRGLP